MDQQLKENHIKTCNKIIEQKGNCKTISCKHCPGHYKNHISENNCFENGWSGVLDYEDAQEFKDGNFNSEEEYRDAYALLSATTWLKRNQFTDNIYKEE
jgi:hypothetical protein